MAQKLYLFLKEQNLKCHLALAQKTKHTPAPKNLPKTAKPIKKVKYYAVVQLEKQENRQ